MLSRTDIARIAEACGAIGNEVCGDGDFVRIRDLLSKFHADIHIRPLLVEGMIAEVTDSNGSRWAVLVDQDTYAVTAEDIDIEGPQNPLPVRFRNTVAHELVHSLAFRPSQFGIRLRGENSGAHQRELVAAIERETERLSPMLLWPEKAVDSFLKSLSPDAHLEELDERRARLGLSKPVFVQRLSLLSANDPRGFLGHPQLQDVALGIAEWGRGGIASVRSWPLFLNFSQGFLPKFLRELLSRDRLPASSFCGDVEFAMLGGDRSSTVVTAQTGTAMKPHVSDVQLRISVELGSRSIGDESLFMIRQLA